MNDRFPWFAAALMLLLPVAAPADPSTIREESRQEVDARALTGVRVDNPRGFIHVTPSRDGRIRLVALKVSTGRMTPRLREFAAQTRVETSTEGGRYRVQVHYPQRQAIRASWTQLFRGEIDLPRVVVRLGLEVPPGLALELRTASGDVETSGVKGSQQLQTTSGDIDVRDAGAVLGVSTTSGDVDAAGVGRARVRSVSGDVVVADARGPLDVETTSGDVELEAPADSVVVRSVSGDVRLDRAPRGLVAATTSGAISVDGAAAGSVRLHSTSGRIVFGLDRGAREVQAASGSGEVEVRVAEGLGCDLTLASTSGTLECSLPMRIRKLSRNRMEGVVGDGRTAVVLKSISGDITVSGVGR